MTAPGLAGPPAGEAPPARTGAAAVSGHAGERGPAAGLGPADIRLAQRVNDAATVETEKLHRRRLHTAWLHGTRRTSADRIMTWPWVLIGLLVVVLIAAGLGIAAAFRAQQRADQEQQRKQSQATVVVPHAAHDATAHSGSLPGDVHRTG